MKTSNMLILIMALILMSCQDVPVECVTEDGVDQACVEESTPEGTEVTQETGADSEVPDESRTPASSIDFKTNVTFFNFEQDDKVKVTQALKELVAVVKSEKFKYEVLHHTYNGEETFIDNEGLTNAEIYQKILEGAEDLLPTVDHEMDLELQLYYRNNSTVGYTYPKQLRIYMNTKFFDRYETEEVANNLIHEWLHKLGFGHSKYNNSRRPYSVPYGVGTIMENLIIEMKQRGELSLP